MPSCSTTSALARTPAVSTSRQMDAADRATCSITQVARRPGNRRHDRALVADQRVEDTGLADVRRAGHDHQVPVAQSPRPRPAVEQRLAARRGCRVRAAAVAGAVDEVIALVGEVDRRLEPRGADRAARRDRAPTAVDRPPSRWPNASRACGRRHRLDQVVHGLGLQQVELAVQERPQRELAGPRRRAPRRSPRRGPRPAPPDCRGSRSRPRPRRCRSAAPGRR